MQHFEFSVKDMKALIASAADTDVVMVTVEYTRAETAKKQFLATVVAKITSEEKTTDGGNEIFGCPKPPGCG